MAYISLRTNLVDPKKYGLLESMGYLRYGLRQRRIRFASQIEDNGMMTNEDIDVRRWSL
jgi:hypothetical protein